MQKVEVKLDTGKTLTYEAPDDVKIGTKVRLPLPWFLDNSSGWIEYPARFQIGTVIGPGSYPGACKPIIGVIEEK